MSAWVSILLANSVHRNVVDHWRLLSPCQTPTSRSSGAGSHSGPLAWRAGLVLDPASPSLGGAPPWGDSLSSWKLPSAQQPSLPTSCILAGGSRGKGSPQSGHRFAVAVVSPQERGPHSVSSTSPVASHGLKARVSPAPGSAGMKLKSIWNLGTEICEWKEEMDLCKRP